MAKAAKTTDCFTRRLLLVGFLMLWPATLLLSAQTVRPFQVQWNRTFGGSSNEVSERIAVASDGGYMVAGSSHSSMSGNKQTPNYGWTDAWVVRIDHQGNKLWERNIGGALGERVRDVKRTGNGRWILAGESASSPSGNKNSPNYGDSDYWVVLLDDQGNTIWEKSYGGSNYDEAVGVSETDNGEFIVAGYSYSGTNEVKTLPNFGQSDLWLLRLSAEGNVLWQTNYGTTHQDWPYAMDRFGTNGFVIAAASTPDGVYAASDFWIVAIDQDGKKLWERFYGGDNTDEPIRIRQTSDGGFITCGWTASGVSGNKTTPLIGSFDFWIVRLNAAGDKLWERTLGHEGLDFPSGLIQTIDGGFVVAGVSLFLQSAWVVRLDGSGNLVWDHAFSVGPNTSISDIQGTQDGGLIAAGQLGPALTADILVAKLAPDALTAPELEFLRPITTGETPKNIMLRGIAGRTYVAEGSEDFVNWRPFATNMLSSNSVELLDQSTSSASRFYRARMLP